MSEVAYYIQNLTRSTVYEDVAKAVREGDKDSLIETCRSVNVPESYIGTLVNTLFSVRQIKWPMDL